MRQRVCLFLVILALQFAGCTDRQDTVSKSADSADQITSATAEAETEPVPVTDPQPDASAAVTPTVPEGMCIACGVAPGDYDGYCYYCSPDFGFECVSCGYFFPSHRTADSLCPNCAAASSDDCDASTGATS